MLTGILGEKKRTNQRRTNWATILPPSLKREHLLLHLFHLVNVCTYPSLAYSCKMMEITPDEEVYFSVLSKCRSALLFHNGVFISMFISHEIFTRINNLTFLYIGNQCSFMLGSHSAFMLGSHSAYSFYTTFFCICHWFFLSYCLLFVLSSLERRGDFDDKFY